MSDEEPIAEKREPSKPCDYATWPPVRTACIGCGRVLTAGADSEICRDCWSQENER